MPQDTIAGRLRYARIRTGLSQTKAAKKLHRSRMAVAHWENGNALPPVFMLADIADLYEVSIDYLLRGTLQR